MLYAVQSETLLCVNIILDKDKRTTTNAIRYRINQEIKFLYCKKQNINQRLHHMHLEGAQQFNGMWQHIQNYIDTQNSLTLHCTQHTSLSLSVSLCTAHNTHLCLSQSHSAPHTTHISVSLSLTPFSTQHTYRSATCRHIT